MPKLYIISGCNGSGKTTASYTLLPDLLGCRQFVNSVKIIEEAQSVGYEVTLLYFWLNSPELAVKRVRDRVAAGGHDIPESVIRRRYVMGLKYFFETYKPICDHWILADNSKSPFTIVARGSKHLSHIKDTEKFRLIWNIAYPNEEY